MLVFGCVALSGPFFRKANASNVETKSGQGSHQVKVVTPPEPSRRYIEVGSICPKAGASLWGATFSIPSCMLALGMFNHW